MLCSSYPLPRSRPGHAGRLQTLHALRIRRSQRHLYRPDGGKNIGITAGGDIGFRPFHDFYPSVEVRGTYPIDDGQVDSQKNILVGGKVERFYGNFHPYADFFFGRGKIDYLHGGYPNPAGTLLYLDSISNVYAGGGGLDFTLTDHFALKIDAEYQH